MTVSYPARSDIPTTAFGEVAVAQAESQFSVMHTYGIDPAVTQKWISPSGGTATISSTKPGMVEVTSGTSSGTRNHYRSRRALFYRPGRGALLRQTGMFGAPVAGNRQMMGLTTFIAGFAFGYDTNGRFGIVHTREGQFEVWALTVTGGAAAPENATITVNATPYTVALTAGTAAYNASEIQASLQTQLAALGYIVMNTGATVILARAYNYSALGTMAFSSGTATAAWSRTLAGAEPVHYWTYQADWNGLPVPWFDPQKGNVYQIEMQYLGFGDIRFSIIDPGTGKWVPVHTIRWGGANTQLSVANPNMFATWAVDNVTNTSAVTMYAGCAWGAVQGQAARPNIQVHNFTKSGVTTAETYLFGLRNDIASPDGLYVNQSSFRLAHVSAVTDSTKGARVAAYKFAALTGPQWVNHSTAGYNSSHVSYDTTASAFALTNAVDVMELLMPPSGRDVWDIGTEETTIPVYPNETIVFTGRVLSGAAASIDVTITWDEQR